jgi:hypothetical protein
MNPTSSPAVRSSFLLLLALALVLGFAGCVGPAECETGDTDTCTCTGGGSGTRACDGNQWGECDCGGGDADADADGDADADADGDADADADVDADADADADADGDADGCTAYSPSPEHTEATYDGSDGDYWYYLGEEVDLSALTVENYAQYGGPTTAGTHQFGSNEESYADCGFCLLYYTDCTEGADGVSCDKVLMPQATGSYTVNSLGKAAGETFSVSLSAVVLQEVTIDEESFATAPVSGGTTVCISSTTMAAQIATQ